MVHSISIPHWVSPIINVLPYSVFVTMNQYWYILIKVHKVHSVFIRFSTTSLFCSISQLEVYFILHLKVLVDLEIQCSISLIVCKLFRSQFTVCLFPPSLPLFLSLPHAAVWEKDVKAHRPTVAWEHDTFATLWSSLGTWWIPCKVPLWNQCQDKLLNVIWDTLKQRIQKKPIWLL